MRLLLLVPVLFMQDCSVLKKLNSVSRAPSDEEAETAECLEISNSEALSALSLNRSPYTPPAVDLSTIQDIRLRLNRAPDHCRQTANWQFAKVVVDFVEAKKLCEVGYHLRGGRAFKDVERSAIILQSKLPPDSEYVKPLGVILEVLPKMRTQCFNPSPPPKTPPSSAPFPQDSDEGDPA